MLFWFWFALMTGAAVFSVLWPLSHIRRPNVSAKDADIAVYRDQLAEIKSDRMRGVIAEPEAEAARIEVARRLLSVSDEKPPEKSDAGSLRRRRTAALMALAGIPLVAFSLYFSIGSAGQSGAPLSPQAVSFSSPQDIPQLISRMESHLAEQPNDGRGWEILAPVYLRLGRTEDAVRARKNALRLLGQTADRQAYLGEAIVMASDGLVTAEARDAFEQASRFDPRHTEARFFLGLAAEQDGRKDEAEKIWQNLLVDAPANSPWLSVIREELAKLREGEKGAPK